MLSFFSILAGFLRDIRRVATKLLTILQYHDFEFRFKPMPMAIMVAAADPKFPG